MSGFTNKSPFMGLPSMVLTRRPLTSEFFDRIIMLSFHCTNQLPGKQMNLISRVAGLRSCQLAAASVDVRPTVFEQRQLFSDFSHETKFEVHDLQAFALAHIDDDSSEGIDDHAVADVDVAQLVRSDYITAIF